MKQIKILYQKQEGKGPTLGYTEESSLGILEKDGCYFKDYAGNGELEPYADWRLSAAKKGIVLGWSTMGMVLGNATYAPYITKAFDAIGVGVTYTIIACVFWVFAVLTIVAVKDLPEEMGTYPDGDPAYQTGDDGTLLRPAVC